MAQNLARIWTYSVTASHTAGKLSLARICLVEKVRLGIIQLPKHQALPLVLPRQCHLGYCSAYANTFLYFIAHIQKIHHLFLHAIYIFNLDSSHRPFQLFFGRLHCCYSLFGCFGSPPMPKQLCRDYMFGCTSGQSGMNKRNISSKGMCFRTRCPSYLLNQVVVEAAFW